MKPGLVLSFNSVAVEFVEIIDQVLAVGCAQG